MSVNFSHKEVAVRKTETEKGFESKNCSSGGRNIRRNVFSELSSGRESKWMLKMIDRITQRCQSRKEHVGTQRQMAIS